jgi:hypothetical protein
VKPRLDHDATIDLGKGLVGGRSCPKRRETNFDRGVLKIQLVERLHRNRQGRVGTAHSEGVASRRECKHLGVAAREYGCVSMVFNKATDRAKETVEVSRRRGNDVTCPDEAG